MMIIMAPLKRQHAAKVRDTCKDSTIIPTGLTVVLQRGDGGPWTHGTVVKHATQDHNNRSYKFCIKPMAAHPIK